MDRNGNIQSESACLRILALDVHYHDDARATAAGVVFQNWNAISGMDEISVVIEHVAAYQPGEFYRRELPCLLAVVHRVSPTPNVIVIDGYVWLDANQRPGLGARLYEELGRHIPIVGVAKTKFHSASAIEIFRGHSRSPLFVTSIGLDTETVATAIRSMAGSHRIPTLLKRVDQLSRSLI